MKTPIKTVSALALASALVSIVGCGGGGEDFLATPNVILEPLAKICHDALVAQSVASVWMLKASAVIVDPLGQIVTFYNGRMPADPLYHVFGSCRLQDGVVTRIGQ